MKPCFLEVAVDSLEALKAAEEAGADRIELCAHLGEGGLSPTDQLLSDAVALAKMPIRVMVRPRSGDFIYTNEEFQLMKDEILRAKRAGVEGVVLGMLVNENEIDVRRTKALVDLARPMKSTFHRAFDTLKNPLSFDQVMATGVDTLLTSGGAELAEQGVETIARLVEKSKNRVSILAGGGIRGTNVARIVKSTSVRAVHVGGGMSTAQRIEEIGERVRFVRQELTKL
jgi:copper homeostasis protein